MPARGLTDCAASKGALLFCHQFLMGVGRWETDQFQPNAHTKVTLCVIGYTVCDRKCWQYMVVGAALPHPPFTPLRRKPFTCLPFLTQTLQVTT